LVLRHFRLLPDAEVSVEIDPCEVDIARLDALVDLGLNRASIGVQDFDPRVQAAIGRTQSWEVTRDTIAALRARGVASVNVDLLYGLPHQTGAGLLATIAKVRSLVPDRLALYGYAHVPWMARRQRLIDEDTLPDAAARLRLHGLARNRLLRSGYVPVGIDHFALPGDGLAEAARTKRLRRSFQGYTTDLAETLIGIGASAVSRFAQGYAQNAAGTADWQGRVADSGLATVRGYALSAEDMATADIIERLMCDGSADIAGCCAARGVAPAPFLDRADAVLAALPGAAARTGATLTVGAITHARLVAAHFDTGFRAGEGRFSMAG
jgi:oxygen-independent coproporphyrinogen-3 oxidase